MFMTTFRSIQRRQNAIRDNLKLCKEQHDICNDRNIYIIYEHEAIRMPKSENNIEAPKK